MVEKTVSEPTAFELTTELGGQLRQLARDEVALAKAELFAGGRQMTLGAGLFGGAALMGLAGFGTLVAAAVAGVALKLPMWAAALIIGAALLAVAGGLALAARQRMKRGLPPFKATADTLRADVSEVTSRIRR